MWIRDGGRVCLDFAITLRSRWRTTPEETLRGPDHLMGRLRQAHLLAPGDRRSRHGSRPHVRPTAARDRRPGRTGGRRRPTAHIRRPEAAQPIGSGGPQIRPATRHHRRPPGGAPTPRPSPPTPHSRRHSSPRTPSTCSCPPRSGAYVSAEPTAAHCASWTAPRPQPRLVLHVPLRKPHQGPPPSGTYTTERPDGKLTEESSAHPGGLIRKAGPGTLSMSCACTGWPRSQRIWASTCAPHPRCRASTAGPSGSAR